jgi:hypothetical protein
MLNSNIYIFLRTNYIHSDTPTHPAHTTDYITMMLHTVVASQRYFEKKNPKLLDKKYARGPRPGPDWPVFKGATGYGTVGAFNYLDRSFTKTRESRDYTGFCHKKTRRRVFTLTPGFATPKSA